MNKKGQAAMEFLMTYGWAILVVLIAIGALAYFGVLNPGRFLPSTCNIMPGISCNEFKISATSAVPGIAAPGDPEVLFILQNGMGKDITSVSLTMVGTQDAKCVGDISNITTTFTDGLNVAVGVDCDIAPVDTPTVGSRFRSDITFTWTADGVQHTRTGRIVSEVEA